MRKSGRLRNAKGATESPLDVLAGCDPLARASTQSVPRSAVVAESIRTGQDALPACLAPWTENPYRLVSFWQMFRFDAGRLVRSMQYLAETSRILESSEFRNHPYCNALEKHVYDQNLRELAEYCEQMEFRLTKVTVDRLLRMIDDPRLNNGMVADLLGEAMRRLRDETEIHKVFALPPEKLKYYECAGTLFGDAVNTAFPSANYDLAEASRCFALRRSTACVFHLMRALEVGLGVFAQRFGVPADHTNWHNVIEGIEKAIRSMGADPATRPADWKDQQEFFAKAASHFMVMKAAWRNYTAHARGKYTDEEAETLMINVRGFMQKLATCLHE